MYPRPGRTFARGALPSLAAALTAALLLAFPGGRGLALAEPPPPAGVVGGHPASAGKWPDVVAIYVGTIPFCTGVLVAPTVVLTAGHCNTSGIMEVLVGAETLADGNSGERIAVSRRIEYPDWDNTFDVLVLVLARPSTRPPRKLASGWAGTYVADGAQVQVVGFGAIDPQGTTFLDELQEATTVVTDASCLRASGCNLDARPAGELGAGGMGIDSCSGDSGGPLYVTGPLGTFVAGLTSRSYDNSTLPCSEGGIYTRADRIADWIEREAGVPIGRGPEPTFDPIEIAVGEGARTRISANDPLSEKHRYAIAVPPARGTAKIDDDGDLSLCATGAGAGEDQIIVEVTDARAPSRKTYVTVPVTIADGVDDGGCELPDDGGCGCQGGSAGGSLGGVLLALAALIALPRSPRRPRQQRGLRRRADGFARHAIGPAVSATCHLPEENAKPSRGSCV